MSVPEDELIESPVAGGDNAAESEKMRASVETVVERYWPANDCLQIIADHYHKDVADLNDDEKETAEYNRREYERAKGLLIDEIVKAGIPEKDLQQYLETVMQTSKVLSEKDMVRPPEGVAFYVKISDSLEKANTYHQLAEEWSQKFLTDASREKISYTSSSGGTLTGPSIFQQRANAIANFINKISGVRTSPRPPIPSSDQIKAQFRSWVKLHETLLPLSENFNSEMAQEMRGCIEAMTGANCDAAQLERAVDLCTAAINEDEDTRKRFVDVVRCFGRTHHIEEDTSAGFITNVLPMIRDRDPRIEILLRQTNMWGMKEGDFGVADFLVDCLTKKITPANLNEMTLNLRDVPATSLARFEQNRRDGLSLRIFGILRDFIHDQRPGVHNVVKAMVDYYDDPQHDVVKLRSVVGRTDYMKTNELIYDLHRYDTDVEETINDRRQPAKAIDVLRRVMENTQVIDDSPSAVSNSEVNNALSQLDAIHRQARPEAGVTEKSENQGDIRAALGQSLDETNRELYQLIQQGAIGIEPNMIQAIAWLEQRAFEVLQSLNYDDQLTAYLEPWFQSLVVFEELTHNPDNFDSSDLQSFIGQLSASGQGLEPYRMVSARMLGHVKQLADRYKSSGRADAVDALWSGNVIHEFMTLAGEWRKPNELSVPAAEKHYRDLMAERTGD